MSANGLAKGTTQVALIESARRALEQARTIEDVKDVRDKAESVRQYMKQVGDSLEAQNIAAELKLRAERKLGAMLADGVSHNGGRPKKNDTTMGSFSLDDIGLSANQSHRYQREAMVSEEDFEEFIEQVKSEHKELTTAALLRLAVPAKESKPRDEWTLKEWVPYVRKFIDRVVESWPVDQDAVLADLLADLAERVRTGAV